MPPRSLRILLLEDNDWDAKTVSEALAASDETRGFLLVRAKTLAEAERRIDDGPFDVVLSDLNVGDSRGLDTARRLVGRLKGQTPVVVLTGSVSDQLGVVAIKAGAIDFLGKDKLDPRRLALSVRFAIERSEGLRAAASSDRHEQVADSRAYLMNAIAHELNQPITPLAIQLHMIRSRALGPLTEAQEKCVAVLYRNITRLQGLIKDVLDIARINAGSLSLRVTKCDLAKLAREMEETYRPMAQQAGVQLAVKVPPVLTVVADPMRITQVLFNFLSNALKYTPSGGTITISCEAESGAAIVRVTDTGAGLTAPQISKLFQPFSQVHVAPDVQKPGSGLGLFISKGIVERHGGAAWCESPGPGKGSTFGFKLPVDATPFIA